MNSKLKDLQWYKSAPADEQKLFKEWLVGVLKTNTVDLTFKKKDDTIRQMKCKPDQLIIKLTGSSSNNNF
jgi:hypothetical protein